MMKKVCALFMAIVLMLMCVSPVLADSGNMLKDPGFENPLSNGWPDEANWRFWSSNTLEQSGYVTTDVARGGKISSFIKHITKKRVTFAAHVVEATELDKNKNYNFNGWFKLDDVKKQSVEPRKDNSGVGVYLCVVYKKGGVAGKDVLYQRSTQVLSGTGDWQNLSFTFNPAQGLELGADFIHICYVMAYATGTVYVDDMSLTETKDAVSEELLTNPDGSLFVSSKPTTTSAATKSTTASSAVAKSTTAASSTTKSAPTASSATDATTPASSAPDRDSSTTQAVGTTALPEDTSSTSAESVVSNDSSADTESATDNSATDPVSEGDTKGNAFLWPIVIVLAVAIGALVIFLCIKKSKK